jgi:hypothetical protein
MLETNRANIAKTESLQATTQRMNLSTRQFKAKAQKAASWRAAGPELKTAANVVTLVQDAFTSA